MPRNNKKGGSLASDPYSHLPKQAPNNLPYPDAYDNVISAVDLIKNYGSVYKTTGGGLSKEKAYSFVSKFIDNRVLDIYLKYLGITTLTPTTLVPIALIYGQKAFKQFLKHMKSQEQVGGSIPVLDNALIGTYLKIAGLTKLNLSPYTLVPLGLAMAIYKTFYKKDKARQTGGNIGRLFTGEYVPPGFLQLGNMVWNGQSIPNNISSPLSHCQQMNRPLSYINNELQTPCSGNACASTGLPPPPVNNLYVDVKGTGGPMQLTDQNQVLGVTPISNLDISNPQFSSADVSDNVMRNQMAGSCYQNFEPPKTTSVELYPNKDFPPTYDVPVSNFCGGGRNRRNSRNNKNNRNSKNNRTSRNNRNSRNSKSNKQINKQRTSKNNRQRNSRSNKQSPKRNNITRARNNY